MRPVILAFLLLLPSAVLAQSPTSVSLIDGGRQGDGRYLAGVEITLTGDAKTYWRSPGDSGVAPDFNFSGSENVADVRVNYPAPERFSDGGGTSIGYKKSVIFPLVITPKNENSAVQLKLALNFAICDKLCIPASSEANLALGNASALPPRLVTAMEQVPGSTDAKADLAFVDGALRITLAAPAEAKTLDLFIEGPNNNWGLPLPTLLSREGDKATFSMPLEGAPKGEAWAGQPFTFTLTFDGKGQELRQNLP